MPLFPSFFSRPRLTVALPIYRSRRIGWLALESLARQRDIDFPWELIVAEERKKGLRKHGVRAYQDRLRRAGCVRIRYISLKRWIPLSLKWRLIARNAAASSSILVLQAADCYSPPRRLRETFDLMSDPTVDWCQIKVGAIYHVRHRKAMIFDATLEDYPTAYYMAVRPSLLRGLPSAGPERFVDKWLFEQAAQSKGSPLKVVHGEDWWRGGCETKGLNSISTIDHRFDEATPPFRPDDEDVMGYLPGDIRQRLHALADDPIPLDEQRLEHMNANLKLYQRRQRRRRKRPCGKRGA